MCLEYRFVKLPSPEEANPLGMFFTQRILPKNMCHARRHLFKFAEFRCLEMGDSRPSGSSLESGEELDAGATFLSLPNPSVWKRVFAPLRILLKPRRGVGCGGIPRRMPNPPLLKIAKSNVQDFGKSIFAQKCLGINLSSCRRVRRNFPRGDFHPKNPPKEGAPPAAPPF